MAIGEEVEFTAVGKDQSGAIVQLENPMWSLGGSGNGGGTFDPGSGSDTTIFTATTPGSRQVFCEEGGVSGAALVTITDTAQLAAIEIDPASISVDVNGEVVFSATGKDQYGDDFPLDEPVWSVSGDGDGSFDPTSGTSTTFTATYPGACTISCAQGRCHGHRRDRGHGRGSQACNHRAESGFGADSGRGHHRLHRHRQRSVRAGLDSGGPGLARRGRRRWRLRSGRAASATTFTATATGNTQIICAEDGVEGTAEVAISAAGLPAPRRPGRRVSP